MGWRDLRDCMGVDDNVKAIKARDTVEDTKSCMPKKELATMLKCKTSELTEACLTDGGKDKMVTEEMFTSSVGSKAVVPNNVDDAEAGPKEDAKDKKAFL